MISVIIPVYNSDKYLRRCLDSVLAQTYKDIEVILVDDGSLDSSGYICDEYAKSDARVKVIHKDNEGVADARNTGINAASGDYIGFVDSDDYIEPQMYEKLFDGLISEKAQICCCGYYQEEKAERYKKNSTTKVAYEGTESVLRAYFRQDYETGIGSGNWNKLFTKTIIGNTRFKRYTNGEDVDFQCEIFKKCGRMVCLSDIFYHYMCADNDKSATNKPFDNKYLSILNVADAQVEYIRSTYPDILPETYAFHLTWYMSVLQKIYESGNIKRHESAGYIGQIRRTVKNKFKHYSGNKYVKRLDKYYMYALLLHCVPVAITFRSIVINIRKMIL